MSLHTCGNQPEITKPWEEKIKVKPFNSPPHDQPTEFPQKTENLLGPFTIVCSPEFSEESMRSTHKILQGIGPRRNILGDSLNDDMMNPGLHTHLKWSTGVPRGVTHEYQVKPS